MATATADTDALHARLDALLESYLSLLHTYTILRAKLSSDLSSGFFALAQANRHANSMLGPGRRYGEEGFDERMKALRTVRVGKGEGADSAPRWGSGIWQDEEDVDGQISEGDGEDVHVEEDTRRQEQSADEDRADHVNLRNLQLDDSPDDQPSLPTPPESPDPSGTNPKQKPPHSQDSSPNPNPTRPSPDQTPTRTTTTISPTNPNIKDPLKWYGILVPPTLRTCQTHFTSAVASTVPNLLDTISAMRETENEIWSVRRKLGIVDDADEGSTERGGVEGQIDVLGGPNTIAPNDQQLRKDMPRLAMPSSPTRSKISSINKSPTLLSTSPSSTGLPSEPRSRVLKLD